MPSERDLVNGDEELLAALRPHPVVVLPPLAVLALAVAIAVTIAVRFPSAPIAVALVLAAMVVVPACWAVGRVVRWRSTLLSVTNRRIVSRRGVLRRDLVQLRLQRVSEVECRQTLVDRLIGRGRLVFEVVGGDGPLVVDDVRRPRRLQQLVTAELDAFDGRGSSLGTAYPPPVRGATARWRRPPTDTPPHGTLQSAAAGNGTSVSDALFQLDELRRRGVISETEFSAKKAELLARL